MLHVGFPWFWVKYFHVWKVSLCSLKLRFSNWEVFFPRGLVLKSYLCFRIVRRFPKYTAATPYCQTFLFGSSNFLVFYILLQLITLRLAPTVLRTWLCLRFTHYARTYFFIWPCEWKKKYCSIWAMWQRGLPKRMTILLVIEYSL